MSAIHVGDRIERVEAPIERIQLVKYAGASGDFNRIHVEEDFARAAGYPSVFAHGMLSMGFLGQLLAGAYGPGAVRNMRARFTAITWPGDTVTCRGEVTAVREEGGERLVELKVWAETKPGTVTVEGTALVAVPLAG
jgi:acyl dehydratase